MQSLMALVGRALLVSIFLNSGISKIFNWGGTAERMAAKGMPWVPLFLFAAINLEILGALSVLLGYRTRLGTLALIVFLIPTTLIFHNFWPLTGPERQMQMVMFMKNMAILGGLLFIGAMGPGSLSIDGRGRR